MGKFKRFHKMEKEKEVHKMNDVWDSGLKTVKPKIFVPEHILNICNEVQKQNGSNEYSMLLNGQWREQGFIIEDKYYIPKQEVSGASVDYKEDIGQYKKEYNTIMHSHPFASSSSFSSADDENINSNFLYSLLFAQDGFCDAIINVDVGEGIRMQVKPEIVIYRDAETITIQGFDNIKSKSHVSYNYGGGYQNEYGRWDNGKWSLWEKEDMKGSECPFGKICNENCEDYVKCSWKISSTFDKSK